MILTTQQRAARPVARRLAASMGAGFQKISLPRHLSVTDLTEVQLAAPLRQAEASVRGSVDYMARREGLARTRLSQALDSPMATGLW